MSYFGTFLLVWLAVGFIVGIKQVYVKQHLDGEKWEKTIEEAYDKNGRNPVTESVVSIMSNKKNYIAIATLLGFVSLYAEIIDTYKDIRNWFRKRKVSK